MSSAACEKALAETSAQADIREDPRDAFPDAGDIRHLAVGAAENVLNALGMSFDDAGCVSVAADAERILTRDFHQVGGFGQQAGIFPVLHRLVRF